MTAMPMVCDISCGSQCHMKMQGFLFKGQEKLPKALKYKLISFFFFFLQLLSNIHGIFHLFSGRVRTFTSTLGTLYCNSAYVYSWPISSRAPFLTRHQMRHPHPFPHKCSMPSLQNIGFRRVLELLHQHRADKWVKEKMRWKRMAFKLQNFLLEASFIVVFLTSLADLHTTKMHSVWNAERPTEKGKEKMGRGTTVYYKSTTKITLKCFVTIKHLWVMHQPLNLMLCWHKHFN